MYASVDDILVAAFAIAKKWSVIISVARASYVMSHMVIVCGAGISASAGIPTYRDADDGLWNVNDMKKICVKGNHFAKESIDFYNAFRALLGTVNPSVVHQFLAALQQKYGEQRVRIFTQNVDDLLERAGCTVTHLHGSAVHGRCTSCNAVRRIGYATMDEEAMCACGGKMRNDVVFYGEPGNYEEMIGELIDLRAEDVFVLMGTSCQACCADAIVKPLRYTKIYVNPRVEEGVDVSQYTCVLQKKAEDCVGELESLLDSFMH